MMSFPSVPHLVVCFFISSGCLENCFSPSNKTTLELLTIYCKITTSSLPSNHVLFWVDSKRQNRLILPEILGTDFAAEVNKNLRLHIIYSQDNHLFLGQYGWVVRISSGFVLKHLIKRHLTLKFYFHMYWLERPDLPPPLNLTCQLSFLTKYSTS